MAVFGPDTGIAPFSTLARTNKALLDNGAANGTGTIAQMLGLIALDDMAGKLMKALDVIEDVPADTTSFTLTSDHQNKTLRFLCTGNCAVNLPASMPRGFLVDWIQYGTGILTFQSAAGAGQSVTAFENALRSGGIHARGTVEVVAGSVWNLAGQTQV